MHAAGRARAEWRAALEMSGSPVAERARRAREAKVEGNDAHARDDHGAATRHYRRALAFLGDDDGNNDAESVGNASDLEVAFALRVTLLNNLAAIALLTGGFEAARDHATAALAWLDDEARQSDAPAAEERSTLRTKALTRRGKALRALGDLAGAIGDLKVA